MATGSEKEIKIAICWGSFDMLWNWYPNPHLKIPADEQYRQNLANGFIKENGKRNGP